MAGAVKTVAAGISPLSYCRKVLSIRDLVLASSAVIDPFL